MAKVFSRQGGWSESLTADSFRSGLEVSIAKQMDDAKIPFRYEMDKISYVIPVSTHTYNPDFILSNGIIVEGKGIFDIVDRKKHTLIKKQYPHLDIRFVFSNPMTKLYKGSKTTYAQWCEKYDFKYAKKFIPNSWFKEGQKDLTGVIAKDSGKKK